MPSTKCVFWQASNIATSFVTAKRSWKAAICTLSPNTPRAVICTVKSNDTPPNANHSRKKQYGRKSNNESSGAPPRTIHNHSRPLNVTDPFFCSFPPSPPSLSLSFSLQHWRDTVTCCNCAVDLTPCTRSTSCIVI